MTVNQLYTENASVFPTQAFTAKENKQEKTLTYLYMT